MTIEPGARELPHGRGNRADFAFGFAEGWDAFKVVRWHAVEQLSRPFHFEVVLLREAARGHLHAHLLLDAPTSFAIRHQHGTRLVHGIVGHAEEFERTSALSLYRIELVLVHRVETFAQELEPAGTYLDFEPFGFDGRSSATPFYENRCETLVSTKVFRPELATPKPRIAGFHRAVVTCEEGSGQTPDINTNANGDVRIRFAWDDRPMEPGIASSKWVPVMNPWGGTGWGSIHTPRVGQTVMAAFHDGDPDQPAVVGGYYSQQTPPPHNPSQQPSVSGLTSQSTPGGGGYNRVQMDDTAGAEQLSTFAQRDASDTVGNDYSNSVAGDADHSIGNDYSHDVGNDFSSSIGGDASHDIAGDWTHGIGGDSATAIAGTRSVTIGGSSSKDIGADSSVSVKGDKSLAVSGALTVSAGNIDVSTPGKLHVYSNGAMTLASDGDRADITAPNHFIVSGSTYLTSKDTVQVAAPHFVVIGATDIRLVCGGSSIIITSGGIKITSAGVVEVNGGLVKLNCE